ncbi:hypothetical protein HZA33_03530 [Candidatus Pacearchaeota archaeon]|nr:hypothetical protein [Candidatus Pacearchaeota archaeon]
MKLGKKEIERINKALGGHLSRQGSLDYALEKQEDNRLGDYTKLAYLWRAILVDHPFSDASKRTAVYLALVFAEQYRKIPNKDLLIYHALSIAKNNITNIRNITRRLKNAIF